LLVSNWFCSVASALSASAAATAIAAASAYQIFNQILIFQKVLKDKFFLSMKRLQWSILQNFFFDVIKNPDR
jgi:hypothetical protein